MPIPPDSALHRLQPGEMCIVVLHDGTQRAAVWRDGRFHFTDAPPGSIAAAEVYEWWPASVPW